MPLLFILFVIVPFVEIWGILKVGAWLGPWPTLLAIILTALIGSMLLKSQGLHTLTRVKVKLDAGEVPVHEIMEALLLAIAGVLLLTPGFFTDVLGLLLLFPPTRSALVFAISQKFAVYQMRSRTTTEESILEGEFRREE